MGLGRLFCFVVLLTSAGSLSAVTWDVAVTGCSDVTCNPCCTIQEAVTRSSGGDTISVGPGTYPEEVDLRNMFSIGDITLESSGGPGTVLVSPSTGRGLTMTGFDTNTVTVDGINFTTTDSGCIFLAHAGDVVLSDVTANDCGYTAFGVDALGHATLERCTANGSARTGIQVDGSSAVTLTDCTADTNDEHGIYVLNVAGSVEITNPATTGNDVEGIKLDTTGSATITGATVTGNGRVGIFVAASDSLEVVGSTVTGNADNGIFVEQVGPGPMAAVTLTNTDVDNNGYSVGEIGAKLRDVVCPVVITNCSFDDNADDGFLAEDGVVGDLEIYGGHANGNGEDGFDLRAVGNVTVIGAVAGNNADQGFEVSMPGTVFFQDCVANGNITGAGFDLSWQDPDPIDGASVIDCTANNNGLGDGGNGIKVQFAAGPVTVVGTETNGNSRTGLRVDDAGGSVLIRKAVSNFGLEEGIKIDTDLGPVTVLDCLAEGNTTEGLTVTRENVDVESLYVRRNTFVGNSGTGVALSDLSGSGLMSVQCNDIAGNNFGLYLDAAVTVDARNVWWGDASGPAGPGSGTGDGIYAEPGGTILYDPWLLQSIASPLTMCEMFGSAFESGLAEEWDTIVY